MSARVNQQNLPRHSDEGSSLTIYVARCGAKTLSESQVRRARIKQ
jgi:hypothetical protein